MLVDSIWCLNTQDKYLRFSDVDSCIARVLNSGRANMKDDSEDYGAIYRYLLYLMTNSLRVSQQHRRLQSLTSPVFSLSPLKVTDQ
jgi:hypothetical protein